MALGIACAGTGNKEALGLIEPMKNDPTNCETRCPDSHWCSRQSRRVLRSRTLELSTRRWVADVSCFIVFISLLIC